MTCAVAAIAVSTLLAGSASAADLRVFSPITEVVHIPLAGKSNVQINTEINSAARTVCGTNSGCVGAAVEDAQAQLRAIGRTSGVAKVEVARAAPSTIHVALAGKSGAKIQADVQDAAQTVCKAATGEKSEYAACVAEAVADANHQLSYIAKVDQHKQLAAN